MGAFEVIETRLELDGGSFQSSIGDAVNSLGTLESKATGTHKAVGALGVGLAAVAAGGIAKSVGASMDLQSALTESQAIMGSLTQGEMKAMETAAREVGKTTTFSAAEAGDAFYYLASAGMDAEQATASMADVAQFAQAGMFSLQEATDLATDAQSALGMTSEDAAENAKNLNSVMDVLVKSNTLANASVQEFSEALTNKAGAALKQTNKDVEEGAAVLAAYADQGIKGRKAGERLNIVLRDLQTAAREDAEAFQNLGVQVYDADGEMRNMADIIADLEQATAGMSTEQKNAAMATLGLSQQAADGITPLLGQSEAIREYEKELGNAGGTSEEVANNQLKSLSAQWDLLKSQITDIGIGIGNHLLPPLTGLVSLLSDAVGVFVRVNDATDGWLATLTLVGTLVTGLAMAAGSASAVLGAGGFAMAATAAGGALSGLATAATLAVAPITAIGGALLGLPSLLMGVGAAINSVLLSALTSMGSALLGLPALIYSTAAAYATAFVGAVSSAVASLLAFPGAAAAAISAKIAAAFQAGILSTAYTGLRTAALAAAAGTKALTLSLLSLTLPLAALTVAAVALYAAWKTNFLGIRDITSGVVTGIKALISGDFQTVSNLIGGVATRAKQLWTTNIVPLLNTARSVLGRIRSEVIAPFLAWFTPIWNRNLAIVAAEFRKTAQAWINRLSGFVEWARPYVSAFLSAMTAWWGKHGDETMAVVRPLLSGLKRIFGDTFSIITDVVVGALRLMRGDFSGAKDSVLSIVNTLAKGVVDLFKWLKKVLVGNSIIPEMVQDILQSFDNLKSKAKDRVGSMMNSLVDTIKDKLSDFKKAGKDLAKMFADGIKSAAGKPGKAAKNMVQGVRDKFTRSDAKEGPLSDMSKTGPALVETFARGMESHAGRAERAAETVAAAARKPFDRIPSLDDIVRKHGEFDGGAVKEALSLLNDAEIHRLADDLKNSKWIEGNMWTDGFENAKAHIESAIEGTRVPQPLFDALGSGGYSNLEKILRMKREGARKGMIQVEDGGWIDPPLYDKPAKKSRKSTRRSTNTGRSGSTNDITLALTEEAGRLLTLVDEDGNEKEAIRISAGNFASL